MERVPEVLEVRYDPRDRDTMWVRERRGNYEVQVQVSLQAIEPQLEAQRQQPRPDLPGGVAGRVLFAMDKVVGTRMLSESEVFDVVREVAQPLIDRQWDLYREAGQ